MPGQKTGNVIEWKVPAGTRHFVVDKILFQPEAALEFDIQEEASPGPNGEW